MASLASPLNIPSMTSLDYDNPEIIIQDLVDNATAPRAAGIGPHRRASQARPCFRRALRLDAGYFWAWYDLACLDALENKLAAPFRNLYKSIECGFKGADYLKRDPDFKSICRDPRWKVVLRTIANPASAG